MGLISSEIIASYPSPNEILSQEFLDKYKNVQPNWGFSGLGYVVYKRTYARTVDPVTRKLLTPSEIDEYQKNQKLTDKEEWAETIARCIRGAQKIGACYTKEEAQELFDYIFNLKCSFSGRGLWQLGTETVDKIGMDSLLNCWVTKVSVIEDFSFIFMESMLGGGVGPVITKEYTHELPRVKRGVRCRLKNTKDADFIVPDSKEGWNGLWVKILEAYLITGKSFTYSTICVRSSGEPIKTFGGIAPGPKPLIDGVEEICRILENREGKKLRTQDVADIICCGGQVVKSGGVRRTAIILQGDVDDAAYLQLKRWDLGNIPNYRSNSNNSLICPKFDYLSDKYWDGFKANTGEPYGLINIPLSQKYGRLGESEINGFNLVDESIIGYNPCQPKSATILTKNGIKTFGDLNIGDQIWSREGWTTVVNKWSTGIKKVYKYKTTAGFFLGTEKHRIVSNGIKIEAKDAESIDIITGPYINDVVINPEYIMDGLVIGDGSVHGASNNLVYLCIGQDDKDYFQSEVKDLITKHRPGLSNYAYEIKSSITSDELTYTYDRSIPERFIKSDINTKCSFLRGLYSANGSICGNRITLKSSSIKMIEDVQLMLSSIGIKSYYTINKSKDVTFNNGTYTCKQSYDLNISSDRNKFQKLIGFIQNYKNEKLNDIVNNVKQYCKQPKTTFDIYDVEFIVEEEVFDITVDNDSHTYWTQGCDVSNCAEAGLADGESCNLAEEFINNIQSKQEMARCAILLYKTQKAIAAGDYLHEKTNKVVHKNLRLGLGITGVCQKLDVYEEWCDYTYRELRKFDKEYSKKMNIPQSIRLTVVKPSGTLSLLAGSSPGGHPGFSEHHIRRVRFDSKDSLLPMLKKAGFHMEPEIRFDGTLNHNLIVVDFPSKFDSNTLVSKNMSAIKQLELVKSLQTVWADQSVSVTVYYKKEELPDIKEWLKTNYNNSLKTISFLLHSEHGFKQSPLEEITEEQYQQMVKKIKPLLKVMNDNGGEIDSMECVNGLCPIK